VLFPFDLNSLPFTRDLRMTLETARRKPDEVDGGLNIVMDPRHPGGKGPVLDHGAPGDPDATEVICPNVFRVDGEYRMWYLGADADGRRRTGQYAVSKDGFHWEKPKLGLVEFRGSTRNNLVAGPCGEWMFHDPEDPDPGRRFKSLYMGKEMRISTSYSADGLRWRAGREDIFGLGMEVGHVFRFNGCYFANGQGGPAPINRTIPPAVEGASKRIMITYASYDFERWTHAAALSFRKDSIPPRPPEDFEPHRGEQVHEGAAVWNRGNVLIGLYGQYHNATNDRDGSVIDLGLIVSHDGLHFQEPVPDFKMVTSYEEADGAAPRLLQRNAFANMDDRTVYWYSIWKDRLRPQTGVRVATWVRDRLGVFRGGPCEPRLWSGLRAALRVVPDRARRPRVPRVPQRRWAGGAQPARRGASRPGLHAAPRLLGGRLHSGHPAGTAPSRKLARPRGARHARGSSSRPGGLEGGAARGCPTLRGLPRRRARRLDAQEQSAYTGGQGSGCAGEKQTHRPKSYGWRGGFCGGGSR